jgi:hypothetical protein
MTDVYVILTHSIEPDMLVFKNQAWLDRNQAELIAQGVRNQLPGCPSTAIEVRRLNCCIHKPNTTIQDSQ